MSINSAMLAGVSGLSANSAALASISDNISNVNTTGYKRSASDFLTLVTAQSSKGAYAAGGVIATTRRFIGQQGLLARTANATDLGISGQGFFVTTEKAENLQSTDARLFTRAGSFSVDNLGFLKNSAGYYLQGWPIDDEGVVQYDPSDLTSLQSINVTSIGGTAEPTTRATVNANLRSSTTPYAGVPAYDPTTAASSMSGYDPVANTGIKPDFEIQIPVSDSKGGKRTFAISFLKAPTANEWYAELRAVPADDVIGQAAGMAGTGLIRSGIVRFSSDGRYAPTAAADNLFPSGADPIVSVADSTAGAGLRWASGEGLAAQDVRIDFDAAAGGITQFDSQSVVQAVLTNGTTFGNLTNIEIDEDGMVTAIFDNGVTRQIAQVAIATFPNVDGLIPVSGNAYRVSRESGTYNLKPPGQGGAGNISPSTLESSTVDLSREFTSMITTQRAYSASSKIITTADEMLEELIRIRR